MENSSTLLALAGLAVALVSASAIVAALRERAGADGRAHRLAARLLAEAALLALVLALLPLCLAALGASGATLWVACSATAGLLVPAHVVRVTVTTTRFSGVPARMHWPRLAMRCGALALAAFNLANAAQALHPVTPGPYVAAAIWQVLATATDFLIVFFDGDREG